MGCGDAFLLPIMRYSHADVYIMDPFGRHGAVRDIFRDFYC